MKLNQQETSEKINLKKVTLKFLSRTVQIQIHFLPLEFIY